MKGLVTRVLSLFSRGPRCPRCGAPLGREKLAFKRFLTRKEAERLEKHLKLRSHFVYTCPHCKADILDVRR